MALGDANARKPKDKGPWTTQELIHRVQGGDEQARDALLRRYYTRLTRVAHGRLPSAARGLNETSDLVQNTFSRALNGLNRFEPRREGAFFAWLKTIMKSELLDQLRRARRRPAGESAPDDMLADGRTPIEDVISVESMELYERALAELPPAKRHAVILRLEYGMSYAEIAKALGGSKANAMRMTIQRALEQVARRMRELAGET